jgi:hypothetical protein
MFTVQFDVPIQAMLKSQQVFRRSPATLPKGTKAPKLTADLMPRAIETMREATEQAVGDVGDKITRAPAHKTDEKTKSTFASQAIQGWFGYGLNVRVGSNHKTIL